MAFNPVALPNSVRKAASIACAGDGWTMEIVGGAARGLASHDGDFVVSHPSKCASHPPGTLGLQLICTATRPYFSVRHLCSSAPAPSFCHLDSATFKHASVSSSSVFLPSFGGLVPLDASNFLSRDWPQYPTVFCCKYLRRSIKKC
jgi:hypothetical protein